nr:MAG TPA: hypothetical protein [Bacteriophage sp.]
MIWIIDQQEEVHFYQKVVEVLEVLEVECLEVLVDR